MKITTTKNRDFFLDKKREKAKLEAEMKLMVTLRQQIPAGEAKPTGALGVILSQYYINSADFCRLFNNLSIDWTPGIPLRVTVKKGLRAKEYKTIIYDIPTIAFLLDCCEDSGIYNVRQLYDMYRFLIFKLKYKESICFSKIITAFRCKRYKRLRFNFD